MNIDELTIGQIKEINSMIGQGQVNDKSPWVIGRKYLVMTVTMYITGELIGVYEKELLLKDAAWVADTGRFSENLKSCEFEEVEPFNHDVIVGRGTIVDATEIDILPKEQK